MKPSFVFANEVCVGVKDKQSNLNCWAMVPMGRVRTPGYMIILIGLYFVFHAGNENQRHARDFILFMSHKEAHDEKKVLRKFRYVKKISREKFSRGARTLCSFLHILNR